MEDDSLTQVVIPGIPAELLARIDRIAKKEDRSRSSMIRVFLKDRVEQLEGAGRKPKAELQPA